MPIINNPISYSVSALSTIKSVKKKANYDHTAWSSDLLEEVRCEIRNFYRAEQRLICVYCREIVTARSASGAQVEHIIPKSSHLQFMFEPKNLCVTCGDCNEFKANREVLADAPLTGKALRKYPSDTARYRLLHPHFDEYKDHITKVGFMYMPISKKGSHTIYVCNLNRYFEYVGISSEFISNLETLVEKERFHRLNN